MINAVRRTGRQTGPVLCLLVASLVLTLPEPATAQRDARRVNRSVVASDITNVTLVEIPVQVLQQGKPVRGLTKDDFVVTEGKKELPIISLDVVDLDVTNEGLYTAGGNQATLPQAGRRHFLFLFDLSFSQPGNILRSREAALGLLAKGLHPADVAAVATYHEFRGIELALNFTGDRGQIAAAIENLGIGTPTNRGADPLKLFINDFEGLLENSYTQSGTASPGVGFERTERMESFITSLQDQGMESRRNSRAIQQGQVLALGDSLKSLSNLTKEVRGQTQIIFLSEGFDSSVLLGNSSYEQDRIEEINRNVADGQTWKVDSDERYGSTGTISALTVALQELRKSGASIHTVDIAGLRAGSGGEAVKKHDGLFLIADETGGTLVTNSNDLSVAMNEVLDATSVTYVLTVQPRQLVADGSYHPIDVKLTDGQRGKKVTHRQGYFAPLPLTQTLGDARRVETSQLLLGTTEGGTLKATVLALPVRRSATSFYVPVVIEADGADLLHGSTGDLRLEVFGYALRPDGSIGDFFAQALQLDRSKVGETLGKTGLRLLTDLTLPPAQYELRTLIRNQETGALRVTSTALDLPSTDAPWVLPPVVFDASSWVSSSQLNGAPEAYPFRRQGHLLTPSAYPRLPEVAAVGVYGGGWRSDLVTPRIVATNENGKSVDLSVRVRETVPATEGSPEAILLDLDSGRLAKGQWTLRVHLDDAGIESEPLQVTKP